MEAENVVVVAGGGLPAAPLRPQLPEDAVVIAADSGIDRALALGLRIDQAVGDFDSVSPSGLAAATEAGARIEAHPAEKDATDLELALAAAAALSPRRISVVGSDGGRLDHLLASLLHLCSPAYAAAELDAHLGSSRVHVVRGARSLTGAVGSLLSLVPALGPAEGVTTRGLAYPLAGETLHPGTTRGVSNVFTEAQARIEVERGVLLAICPAPEEARS